MNLKEKINNFKTGCKVKYENFKTDLNEHPEKIAGKITIGVAVAGGVLDIWCKTRPRATEVHDKKMEKSYYDPSTGIRWDLRKKMNNRQKQELVRRKREGECTEDILDDLNLLK